MEDVDNDLEVWDEGTIMLLIPTSDAGSKWVDAKLPLAITFSGAVAVEPRYIVDIVEGAREDGLIVEGGW